MYIFSELLINFFSISMSLNVYDCITAILIAVNVFLNLYRGGRSFGSAMAIQTQAMATKLVAQRDLRRDWQQTEHFAGL